jgi:hypothetical protein
MRHTKVIIMGAAGKKVVAVRHPMLYGDLIDTIFILLSIKLR